ncbi:MAG: hypothetical protein ACYTE3_22820 [Planctomycetota bacterium]
MSKRNRKRRKPRRLSLPNHSKPKLLSRISKGNWGIAVGAILMLVLWASQNIYISGLDTKLRQLTTDLQSMNTENGRALQWMLKYQEELRKEPKYDPEVIANTAKGYSSSMEQIFGAAKRVNPQSSILSNHHEKITQYNDRIVAESDDVNNIITMSTEMMQWAEEAYKEAEPELKAIESKINSSNTLWTKVFRFSYIAATCLLAISWFLINGRSLLSLKGGSH